MANFSWKSLSLLVATLLVALALQAGAVKIMINLARQSNPPAVPESRAAPVKPEPSALAALEAERQLAAPQLREPNNPAAPTREIVSEIAPSDPPHLANLPENPEALQHKPVVETPQPATAAPTASAAASQPNPAPPVSPNHPDPAAAPPAATTPVSASADNSHSAAVGGDTASKPNPSAHPAAPSTPTETNAAPSAATAPVETTTGLQETSWLKSRDAKRYTVQIYSGKDLGKLKEIAGAIATVAPQAYYATGSRSGPWYALVAGDYPDSASAQAAAAKITAQTPTIKPWVRRFDEIQAKLR